MDLGPFLMKDDAFKDDMKHEIKSEWTKWRKASGILYNQRIPIWLKDKFYKTVVR